MSDCHGPNGSKAYFASQCYLDSDSYLNAVMESSAQTPNATKPMVEMKNPLKDIKGTELPEEDGPGISSELGLRVASEAHNKADALQRIRSKSFLGELSSPDGSSAEPPEAIEFTRVVIDRQSALHDPDAKIASVIIDKALALRQRWQRSFPAIDPDEHVRFCFLALPILLLKHSEYVDWSNVEFLALTSVLDLLVNGMCMRSPFT